MSRLHFFEVQRRSSLRNNACGNVVALREPIRGEVALDALRECIPKQRLPDVLLSVLVDTLPWSGCSSSSSVRATNLFSATSSFARSTLLSKSTSARVTFRSRSSISNCCSGLVLGDCIARLSTPAALRGTQSRPAPAPPPRRACPPSRLPGPRSRPRPPARPCRPLRWGRSARGTR